MSNDIDTATEERLVKIQKLLAKAERAGTEAEAAAFFAKAEELMHKWAIDDAMLAAAGKRDTDVIEQRAFRWTGSSLSTTWDADMHLMVVISRNHNVRMLVSRSTRTMYLVGYRSDIDNVLTVFTALVVQSARFQREAWKTAEGKEWMGQYDKRVWARSFREGFADRIGVRLREAREHVHAEAKREHGSGMDLVLVDRKDRVDAFYDDIPKGTARSSSRRSDPNGRAAGREAANRADMGQRRVGGRADCPVWRPSELSSSKMAQAWAGQEEATDALTEINVHDYIDGTEFDEDGFVQAVKDVLEACAEAGHATAEDYEDGLSAMPDGLREAAYETEEKKDAVESWADDLDNWSPSASYEPPEPDEDEDDEDVLDDTEPEVDEEAVMQAAEAFAEDVIAEAQEAIDALEV